MHFTGLFIRQEWTKGPVTPSQREKQRQRKAFLSSPGPLSSLGLRTLGLRAAECKSDLKESSKHLRDRQGDRDKAAPTPPHQVGRSWESGWMFQDGSEKQRGLGGISQHLPHPHPSSTWGRWGEAVSLEEGQALQEKEGEGELVDADQTWENQAPGCGRRKYMGPVQMAPWEDPFRGWARW